MSITASGALEGIELEQGQEIPEYIRDFLKRLEIAVTWARPSAYGISIELRRAQVRPISIQNTQKKKNLHISICFIYFPRILSIFF